VSRGLFVVFEGIDGCGKSTHARRVAAERGALFTFEPGDSALGADLRRWLLDVSAPMGAVTEALLMLSDRSYHVSHVVEPARDAGRDVVSDRFASSTLAYQGYGRGLDLELLRAATRLAIGSCRPDRTLLLDVSIAEANERRARSDEDRFESADLAFHERVRTGYLEMAAADPTWVVVDAAGEETEVAGRVDAALADLAWARG
jgi:dTMP kinase